MTHVPPDLRPLSRLRILEVGHMLAGPYCGMLLADLGAEVIKIEAGDGDISRSTGELHIGGCNVYFASLNRNKKSVLCDLKDPTQRSFFEDLVRTSDGLITNLRPSAIKSLGLTYDALAAINPRIACLAITGFGLDGLYSDYPAYDYIIQAMTGLMWLTGEPEGPPVRAGYSVADNTGGMMGAVGLLAKLVSRTGGQIDVAMYDAMISQMNYLAGVTLNGAVEPERLPGGAHPIFVPAQIFEAADDYLALFITHDRFWRLFARAVGKPDWLENDRFATMAARSANREEVLHEIREVLRTRSAEDWLAVLRPMGLVVSELNTLGDALRHPQTISRGMLVEVPTGGDPVRLVGNPIKLSDVDSTYGAAPGLGEHNVELGGSAQPRRSA